MKKLSLKLLAYRKTPVLEFQTYISHAHLKSEIIIISKLLFTSMIDLQNDEK